MWSYVWDSGWKLQNRHFSQSTQGVSLPKFIIAFEHAKVLQLEYFYESEAQAKQFCPTLTVLQHT